MRSHVVVIASGKALEPVADSDQHIFHTPVLQLGEDLQPKPGTLATVTGPDTQDVPFPVRGYSHDDIERGIAYLPVTDLDHDRVNEEHRINRIQRPGGPFGQFGCDFLRDAADGVFRNSGP